MICGNQIELITTKIEMGEDEMGDVITVYSKPNCKECLRLKEFFSKKLLEFNDNVLDVDFVLPWLIREFPTAKNFPVVVVNDKFVGGYDDFVGYYYSSNGNLI